MASNQAVVVESPGKAVVKTVPYPTLPGDDYIIVKTTAYAVNPTDWKHVHFNGKNPTTGCIVGMDYAGVVAEVGPSVFGTFKTGDRVAGVIHGSNPAKKYNGAFAKYAPARAGLQHRIPDNLTDEEAASQGVAMITIGLSLYKDLGLPLPTAPAKTPFFFFIYGGSTAMGISAIQFAKLSGATVITTSSPANSEYILSLGADFVLDYKSETLVSDIIALTDGTLRLALDCQADDASLTICAKVLKGEKPHLASLLLGDRTAIDAINPDLKWDVPLGYYAFGEDFQCFDYFFWEAKQDEYEYLQRFVPIFWGALASGKVKPPRLFINQGGSGLEGVIAGMEYLRQGKVRGGKLVYTA
ncbi:chaperonin 10-like protein [Stachybotrys elegans]|uniref:Chaperonin 10-like protein n=1 Tax=Stachybotrys elegans TaxID=80388 RepID=A0A8K0WUI6_9HYPO|nr:chaperonin 10-like protein [Stachybotrys elegans]